MPRVLNAALVIILTATPASAQVLTNLTPVQIREAIAYGSSEKKVPYYEIRKGGIFGSDYKPTLGSYTTPYLRVAQAAFQAKKQYRSFTEADVTEDMLAPELRVYGYSQAEGPRIANVQAVVITPKKKHEPEDAIRPVSTSEIPVEFSNLMGMKSEGTSLLAVFPLDVLSEDNEVHIIYDSGVHDGGENKYCEDCYTKFNLEKVRQVEGRKSVEAAGPTPSQNTTSSKAVMPDVSGYSESDAAIPPGMYWVVDDRVKEYVPVGCRDVAKIPPRNRLYYRTEEAAQGAGYRRSEKC